MPLPVLTNNDLHKPVSNKGDGDKKTPSRNLNETELLEAEMPKLVTFTEPGTRVSNTAERPEPALRKIIPFPASGMPDDAAFGSFGNSKLLEVVIADDDRELVTNVLESPWKKIAALRIQAKNGKTFVGTAWFISATVLATAGHCLFMHDEGGWPLQIEVIPALNGLERPFNSAFATRFESSNGWVNDRNSDYDYGVIILDQPISESIGWFSVAAAPDEYLKSNIANISGYPIDRDRATRQYYHARNIIRASSRRIYYEIDTYGGQSGAAIWMNLGEGDRVAIGIHTTGNSTSNFGTRITEEVFNNFKTWKNI